MREMRVAKARKLIGYKHQTTNPAPGHVDLVLPDGVIDWVMRRDNRVVVHQISIAESVDTPDGPMMLCGLKQQAEFANPDVDVAMLVGHIKAYRKSGKIDPQSPELWYYNEKFWVKAKNSAGSEYYNIKQQYLLYEVQIRDADSLVATASAEFGAQEPQ